MGRQRRETFLRRRKEAWETLLAENAQLRQENAQMRQETESQLRLLMHMTRQFALLRGYTVTLREWLATQHGAKEILNHGTIHKNKHGNGDGA